MRRFLTLGFTLLFTALPVSWSAAQQPPAPRPFPRPPQQQAPAEPAKPVQTPPAAPLPAAEPSEATLGVPVYPTAQFLVSYDAGQGQRYYLFGTTISFAEVVAYYRSVLKQRGDLVFEEPATHMFSIGRFREETMAFPPSVTVKDYTWGGMGGYLNPKLGGEPASFPTIIQVVPPPAGTPAGQRRQP
ncbi:MAG TPA: hypothetical protein PKK95_00115 [Vicinamibacterales bacterium]|nr:hypothetical protein [Acidobacteriota bacterium]HOC16635.1 hypothetical protein [Vicinamibacterales bacterium]